MKTCFTCKTEKDEAEFSKNKSKKDGLHYLCKSCLREYQKTNAFKAYQQTDSYKEYQKVYQKAYYLRHKAAATGNAGQSSDTEK